MILFREKANGSLLYRNGKIVGSKQIGQLFTKPEYFHGRPSSISYDAGNSGGTNLGPTNQKLIFQVSSTANQFRQDNGLAPDKAIPADIVMSSASGLDPHISLESALLQVSRIANSRGLQDDVVKELVYQYTKRPFLNISGIPLVNVLQLNLALDYWTNK